MKVLSVYIQCNLGRLSFGSQLTTKNDTDFPSALAMPSWHAHIKHPIMLFRGGQTVATVIPENSSKSQFLWFCFGTSGVHSTCRLPKMLLAASAENYFKLLMLFASFFCCFKPAIICFTITVSFAYTLIFAVLQQMRCSPLFVGILELDGAGLGVCYACLHCTCITTMIMFTWACTVFRA